MAGTSPAMTVCAGLFVWIPGSACGGPGMTS
jgi:hypothetical protein